MNTKKKIIFIICGVILVFALAVAGVLIWFFSPGIHTLLGVTHAELSMEGYIVDYNEDTVEYGELTVNCTARDTGSDGVVEKERPLSIALSGYPAIEPGDYSAARTSSTQDDGIMEFSVYKSVSVTEHITYRLLIDTEQSQVLMCAVIVDSNDTNQQYYFIPTNNPDTAPADILDIFERAY